MNHAAVAEEARTGVRASVLTVRHSRSRFR